MLNILKNYDQEKKLLKSYIRSKATPNNTVRILEAGCGRRWLIDLDDLQYHLTGIDIDKQALELRKSKGKDLDEVIEGDLRTVVLPENRYDVIYNSFVLEHIDGAEGVLSQFVRWLKPGGILILRIPDRNSVYGFLTRSMPFWFHVFIRKYLQGNPNAGKPGFDPYPTFYDKVVSRNGISSFCKKHGLMMHEEWGHPFPSEQDRFKGLIVAVVKTFKVLSLGRLSAKHNNLTYILEKPVA